MEADVPWAAYSTPYSESFAMLRILVFTSLLVTTPLTGQTPTAITYGDALTRTLKEKETATYQLAGKQGEKIVLETVTNATTRKFYPCVQISKGAFTKKACTTSHSNRLNVVLPASGAYTIQVWDEPTFPLAGTFTIALERVFPDPSLNSRQITFAQTLRNESISTVGAFRSYWFAAKANATISLKTTASNTNLKFYPCIELWGPKGNLVGTACTNQQHTNTLKHTTTMAGRYVVLVWDQRASFASGGANLTGSYALSLSCASAPCVTNAKLKNYGAGCKGTTGVPKLAAPALPIIGTNFKLQLSSIPTKPFTIASLFIGASQASLPLDRFGMTGCTWLTSPPLSALAKLAKDGKVEWSERIPLNSSLLDATAYFQAWVQDKGANVLGLINSNGIMVTIG